MAVNENECYKVVTIGYLKNFIASNVQNSSNGSTIYINYSDDTYCPTYGELTGGTFIQTWSQGGTPRSDRDGIVVSTTCLATGAAYAVNQLVDQKDLSLKYTRFNSLSISRTSSENITECGGSTGLAYVYNYKRYTKAMGNNCSVTTTETTDASACNELTYYASLGSASCTSFSIGKNGSVSSPARTASIYAYTTFRGSTKTSNTITVTQNALTGSYSQYVTSYTVATGCSARATTSTSFDCAGGTYGAAGTGYYDTYYRYSWTDSCGQNYPSLTSDTKVGSSTTDLGSKSGSFSYHDCCEGSYNDSATLSFSYGSYSDSVSFSQSCADCSSDPRCDEPGPGPCEGVSYLISPNRQVDCHGGSVTFTAS